jgi:O-antigen ligase
MDNKIAWVEKVFAVGTILFFTNAFFRSINGLYDQNSGASTGSLLGNLIWAFIYLSSMWLLQMRCGGLWQSLSNLWPLFWLYAFVFLSITWSAAPMFSFLRFGALAGSTLFGLYCGLRYPLKMQLVLLGWAFGLAAVLSAIFSLLFPDYSIGTGPFAGLWLGIYVHKNALGGNMSMAFIVFLSLAYCYPAKRWYFRILACATVALIVLADSAACFVECIAMCWIFPFLAGMQPSDKPRRASGVLLAITGVPLILSPFIFYEQIVTALGRDVELTGRLVLWPLVAQYIALRPYLGYGYYGFWRGVDGPLGDLWFLGASSAHDGLMAIWLDLGLLGLIASLAVFLIYFRRAFHLLRRSRNREDIWPILFFTWTFLANLTAITYLLPNQASWMLFVAAAAALCVREAAPTRDECIATSNLVANAIGS